MNKKKVTFDKDRYVTWCSNDGGDEGMPRPRVSSILPPKKGIFSGPEVNSATQFKGTCQVACFFVVVVGFRPENYSLPKQFVFLGAFLLLVFSRYSLCFVVGAS